MDPAEYGHRGPIVASSATWRGRTEATWYCETCHHHVPRDEPSRLRDIDCGNYARLLGELG